MMNRKNVLLVSAAAAALIAGAGFGVSVASAQAPPSPAAQQSAPAEKPAHEPKGATQNKAPDGGMKSGKADDKMERKNGRGEHAQDQPKVDKSDVKPGAAHSETKSSGKASSETGPSGEKKADRKDSEKTGDVKAGAADQRASGGSIKLTTEQRTTMQTVIKQHNVQPMRNVNFSISVGRRVPRTVHFYPMPEELAVFYPRWRGYEYFLVGNDIIVVNPRTQEIVAVLKA